MMMGAAVAKMKKIRTSWIRLSSWWATCNKKAFLSTCHMSLILELTDCHGKLLGDHTLTQTYLTGLFRWQNGGQENSWSYFGSPLGTRVEYDICNKPVLPRVHPPPQKMTFFADALSGIAAIPFCKRKNSSFSIQTIVKHCEHSKIGQAPRIYINLHGCVKEAGTAFLPLSRQAITTKVALLIYSVCIGCASQYYSL